MGLSRWAIICVSAILVGVLVPGTGSATGTLTYSDLAPVFRTALVHVPPGKGATVSKNCPTGSHVLTGGAWFNALGQPPAAGLAQTTWLSNSYPTASGWKASGFNNGTTPDLALTINLWCTKSALHTVKLTGSVTLAPGATRTDGATCPAGTQLLYGGAFFHRKGEGPRTGLAANTWLTVAADNNNTSWFYGGRNGTFKNLVLSGVQYCSPALQSLHFHGGYTLTANGDAASAEVRCDQPYNIVGGGASFQVNSTYVTTGVILSSSAPEQDHIFWFSAGKDVSAGNVQIETDLYCLG